MSETNTDQLSLDELRRLEQRLIGEGKIMQRQVPTGITRAEAHARFDTSRTEAVRAYADALDELITALGNLPGPAYTLSLPRRYAGLASLEVLASDRFAETVHARIDAAPLGGGITFKDEKERHAARARVLTEIASKERQAKQVGEIIRRREEEERQRESDEERERVQARRDQQIREDQEHTRRVLLGREEQRRQVERLLEKEKS